jgi:hypothetical protein
MHALTTEHTFAYVHPCYTRRNKFIRVNMRLCALNFLVYSCLPKLFLFTLVVSLT